MRAGTDWFFFLCNFFFFPSFSPFYVSKYLGLYVYVCLVISWLGVLDLHPTYVPRYVCMDEACKCMWCKQVICTRLASLLWEASFR